MLPSMSPDLILNLRERNLQFVQDVQEPAAIMHSSSLLISGADVVIRPKYVYRRRAWCTIMVADLLFAVVKVGPIADIGSGLTARLVKKHSTSTWMPCINSTRAKISNYGPTLIFSSYLFIYLFEVIKLFRPVFTLKRKGYHKCECCLMYDKLKSTLCIIRESIVNFVMHRVKERNRYSREAL